MIFFLHNIFRIKLGNFTLAMRMAASIIEAPLRYCTETKDPVLSFNAPTKMFFLLPTFNYFYLLFYTVRPDVPHGPIIPNVHII